MRKYRIVLLLLAVVIFVWQLSQVDYSNLATMANYSRYIMMGSMLLLCTSIILMHRQEAKQKEKE